MSELERPVGRGRIRVVEGDLTVQDVDAIVNAANRFLQHGGGVAGAIVAAGGAIIQEESDRAAPIRVGQAVLTSGGALPARHVIHAVGPRMGEGDEDRKLRDAGEAALDVAERHGLASVAFPAISSGVFGYPIERSAAILVDCAVRHLEAGGGSVSEIVFCLWGMEAYGVFERELRSRLEPGQSGS